MQAGRQRGALPLIRKFNEHSERLLNSALGETPPAKRRRLDVSFLFSFLKKYASQFVGQPDDFELDIEDLHDPESSTGILLEMQDRQRYFEGRMSSQSDNALEVCPFSL